MKMTRMTLNFEVGHVGRVGHVGHVGRLGHLEAVIECHVRTRGEDGQFKAASGHVELGSLDEQRREDGQHGQHGHVCTCARGKDGRADAPVLGGL